MNDERRSFMTHPIRNRAIAGAAALLTATALAAGTASAVEAPDNAAPATVALTCFVNHDFTVAWSAPVGGNIIARLGKGQGFDARLSTQYRKYGNLWGGQANVFIDHEDLNC
jgi:spore coat protein U-like protein